MTAHKHLKEMVRARMRKTGESYTTARRHIVRQVGVLQDFSPARWHLPGNIPATTALRVVLTAAGVRDPRDGNPLTEAMLFGICGGIGMGIASFYYEKANFSSFYIGGRHLWTDDVEYLKLALSRFGIKPAIQESSGAKAAEKQLRDALAAERPCIALLDMVELPHRGIPAFFSGGGYHVVTVYRIDDKSALIGDLTDVPIEIGLAEFETARARIKQFKNRLLTIPQADGDVDLSKLVRAGLQACEQGLKKGAGKGAGMSGLDMLQKWEAQLTPSKAKDCWSTVFPRGQRLWQGLTSIYDYIENYHTGGGLCRPLFAEFLSEASRLKGWDRLAGLSKTYEELGALWSDLAISAIPQNVPAFREVLELYASRFELRSGGDPADIPKIRGVWARLSEMQRAAQKDFPLLESACTELQEMLRQKVAVLSEKEFAARAALEQGVK